MPTSMCVSSIRGQIRRDVRVEIGLYRNLLIRACSRPYAERFQNCATHVHWRQRVAASRNTITKRSCLELHENLVLDLSKCCFLCDRERMQDRSHFGRSALRGSILLITMSLTSSHSNKQRVLLGPGIKAVALPTDMIGWKK